MEQDVDILMLASPQRNIVVLSALVGAATKHIVDFAKPEAKLFANRKLWSLIDLLR